MLPWLTAFVRLGGDLARREMARIFVAIALWSLAAILILCALGFAVGGVHAAIASGLGPVAARFVMSGGFLALALLTFALAAWRKRRGRRRRPALDVPGLDVGGQRVSLATVAAAFAFGFARGLTRRRKT